MNGLEKAAKKQPPGLSRRQVLCRFAGGIVGGLLASLGLGGGRSEANPPRVVSLRTLMKQLGPNCDPSHGIRLMLPDEGPVISLLDIIRRYYHG